MDEKNIPLQQSEQETEACNALELNEKEQALILELAARIDISNANHQRMYGAVACKKLTEQAESALAAARVKEHENVSRTVSALMAELKSCCTVEKGRGFSALFRSAAKKQEELRARLDKTVKSVDAVLDDLQIKHHTLLEDLSLFETLQKDMQSLYRMFTVFLSAGQQRLRRERETTLASMRVIARRTGISRDAQNVKAFEEACLQFEQKLRQLEDARGVCLQIMPELALLHKQTTALNMQLQSLLQQAAPAWKTQLEAALGSNQQENIAVDVETVKALNAALSTALDALLQTQVVCLQKQRVIEQKLQSIELQLRMNSLES